MFNVYTATGLVLLLLSTALAALTYSASDSVVGVSRDDIEELVDGDHSEIEYNDGLAIAFGEWIEFNSETIDIDAFYFTSTTTSLVGALLAFTYSTEWWSQFRRWLDLVEPVRRAKRFLLSGSDR